MQRKHIFLFFEKDRKYFIDNLDDEDLFKKYNPMIAGCIQGSREILARDIIAVILNLIEKGNIKLDIKDKLRGGRYLYFISKVAEKENEMDDIEKCIYNWVFKGSGAVELADRLKEMPKEQDANARFKQLNKMTEENLAKMGANKRSVPMILRGFNIFLFIIAILVVIKHIQYNGLNIYEASGETAISILVLLLAMWPVLMGVISIFLNLIIIFRHKINKTVQRITGQKVATTTISLIVLFGTIMIITALIAPAKFLIADEFLICIATILILEPEAILISLLVKVPIFKV